MTASLVHQNFTCKYLIVTCNNCAKYTVSAITPTSVRYQIEQRIVTQNRNCIFFPASGDTNRAFPSFNVYEIVHSPSKNKNNLICDRGTRTIINLSHDRENQKGEWSKLISTIEIVFFAAQPNGCEDKDLRAAINLIEQEYSIVYIVYVYII